MIKAAKSKHITIGLIFAFLIFYCPHLLTAEIEKAGNLEGFVYGQDGTSPVEGAVIKVRNIGDGTVYESEKSDMHGAFKIEGIRQGLYVAGITSSSDDFNSSGLIGIKSNETAKVSFSLYAPEEEASSNQFVSKEFPPKSEIRIGKVVEYNADTMEATIFIEEGELNVGDKIRIKGFTVDFYQKVELIKLIVVVGEEGAEGFQEVDTVYAGQTIIIEVDNPVEVGDFVYVVKKKRPFFAFFIQPCFIAALVGTVIIIDEVIKEPEVSPCIPVKR